MQNIVFLVGDRRCRFPVEVGLHLHRPCRLQQVVVVSEPGLAPSVIEFFVAGPTRSEPLAEKNGWKRGSGAPSGADSWNHNGSKKVTKCYWWRSTAFVSISSFPGSIDII